MEIKEFDEYVIRSLIEKITRIFKVTKRNAKKLLFRALSSNIVTSEIYSQIEFIRENDDETSNIF